MLLAATLLGHAKNCFFMEVQHSGKVFVPYISKEAIAAQVSVLAGKITRDYVHAAAPPIFVGVLDGAFMFMADLLRHIGFQAEATFTKFSSYIGTKSSGRVVQLIGFSEDVQGRDIILVEDIVDTGLTLEKLEEALSEFNPGKIRVAALLRKPLSKDSGAALDYLGFDIEDRFVVGYGMDFNGWFRNLPDIYALKP